MSYSFVRDADGSRNEVYFTQLEVCGARQRDV